MTDVAPIATRIHISTPQLTGPTSWMSSRKAVVGLIFSSLVMMKSFPNFGTKKPSDQNLRNDKTGGWGVHVYVHISIYYTLLRKWAILTEGVWWQGYNQKLDNFHVGYVEVHRLKATSRGSLQNLSSPFPGRSNDMEHLVCMVFCDNHSIYRTLRSIIKCGNRKSTATVTNGRLEGIWVFTNKLQSFYILHFYEDAESTRFTNSSFAGRKKHGSFSSPFGWFWVVKVYH